MICTFTFHIGKKPPSNLGSRGQRKKTLIPLLGSLDHQNKLVVTKRDLQKVSRALLNIKASSINKVSSLDYIYIYNIIHDRC